MSQVTVTFSGPFFDERRDEIMDRLVHDIQQTVGDEAFVKWETNMEASIRHSGPVYQKFPQVIDRDGERVVNDGWGQTNDLPYGPWLEGVGSRNSPVTRFPGYFSLKRAFEDTTAEAEELAEPVVDEAMEAMNGE
jgi:hypothetical protein